jgi:Xaa-Pro aminopeptidase
MSEFSADQAFSIHDFENEIRRLLQGKEKLFFTLGNDENYDAMMIRVTKTLKENARREGSTVPLALVDVDHIIAEMRLIKSPAEIELLRLAAQISVAAHQRAMKICKPGLNESQIAAELIYGFMAEGCQDESYNSIVACGGNGVVLHYSANNALLEDGMLLLVDAGGEYRFYDADITTTYPVSGKFSPPQKMIYDLVLKAQSAAFALIKPGTRWVALQEAIVQVLTQGLLELGILQGELHELLLNREFFKFYMHNSGHWLGLDTHDVGAYKINGESRILQPGMVLTVEPGLYFSKDTAGLDPKWHDIAVRIEDDVVVTATGYEILSAGLPRTTEAIEAFMAQKY